MKVPLRIHESHADQRQAEVARFLAVIAREYAEAAGVNRQRLMQRELRREIRDGAVGGGKAAVPPRIARGARRVQRVDGGIVDLQVVLVLRRLLEQLRRDVAEHPYRIVRCLPPEQVVEAAENLTRLRVPCPPQV